MNLIDRVDRFLWRRGFQAGPVRHVARALILTSAGLLALGALLLPLLRWPFWLGVGAVLSAWNFYSLAFFIQHAFPFATEGQAAASASRGLWLGQLARSNLRLFITGFLVYMALVVFRANPFALVAGLSAAVFMMPVLLLIRRDSRGGK